jgi:hypothetical protein
MWLSPDKAAQIIGGLALASCIVGFWRSYIFAMSKF